MLVMRGVVSQLREQGAMMLVMRGVVSQLREQRAMMLVMRGVVSPPTIPVERTRGHDAGDAWGCVPINNSS